MAARAMTHHLMAAERLSLAGCHLKHILPMTAHQAVNYRVGIINVWRRIEAFSSSIKLYRALFHPFFLHRM